MTIKAEDLNKTGVTKVETPVKKVEKKKTASDIYLEGCDEEQAVFFNQIKEALTTKGKGNKREFEAINESRFDDLDWLIEYAINGVIQIEDDGIRFELREPIVNADDIEITDYIKILWKRDETKESIFKKQVKTNKKSDEYESDLGAAVIAASFENVGNTPISPNLFSSLKKTNELDYDLIVKIYVFFRR